MTDQTDRLNDDVVAEILLRLPPAAVLRSRAVCRAWRRITTSPAFLAAHAHRQPLELILGAQGCGALYTVPVPTNDETRRRRLDLRWCGGSLGWLVGTCGGLLLFETGGGRDHIVCNPATRQWMVLPRTPSYWIRACGVYTHTPSGEHRLLYLADDDRQPGTRRTASHRVRTLGASDDEDRRIGPSDAAIEFYTQLAGPYVNHRGNLHWLRHPWVFETDKILAFDAVSETFRRIPRPPLASNDDYHLFLVEAQGNLALTAIVDGFMDLWVLEDYHGSDSTSWTRRLRVNLPPSMLHATPAMMDSDVLGQNVVLVDNVYELVLYHLTEKKVLKEIKLRAEDSEDDDTRWTSHVFRESLERHAFFDLQGTT